MKFDQDKPRYSLLPAEAMEQVALIYTHGAKKYADHNWRKGLAYSRLYDAAQQHLNAFWQGTDIDPEFGIQHLAHAAFNVIGLLQFQLEGRSECDNRYKRDHSAETQTLGAGEVGDEGKAEVLLAVEPARDFASSLVSVPEGVQEVPQPARVDGDGTGEVCPHPHRYWNIVSTTNGWKTVCGKCGSIL